VDFQRPSSKRWRPWSKLFARKGGSSLNLNLEAEFLDSVPDTSFSRSKNTKVFKLIELYGLNKAFIEHVIEEKGQ
jgi:hypothetical protein